MMITPALLLSITAAAIQPPVGLSGDAPIDVAAGRCEVFEADDIIECTGDVRITQGDALLSADRVKIFGAGDGEGFKRIEGEGQVRYASGDNALSGQRAVYDGPNTTITVVGDVLVLQGDQVMSGGKLVYNTTTKAMVFTPGPDGRVRGVFNTASTAQ